MGAPTRRWTGLAGALHGCAVKILLVEDDAQTAQLIEDGLARSGYAVTRFARGSEAVLAVRGEPFDVAILDRMLPDIDGLAVLDAWREDGFRAPVLVLTALGAVADRVHGLERGADDYLVKPFAMDELLARTGALLRRSGHHERPTEYHVGDLSLDLLLRRVRRGGRDVHLQPREFDLLVHLLHNAGQPVTRKMLLAAVWDIHFDPKTNFIDSHISRLRAKLRQRGADPIETLHGVGYRLRIDA
jgi:two-component system OmpR family response regulator